MTGLKAAASYGFIPCQLGLCGPEDKKKKAIISQFLKGKKGLEQDIREILTNFKGAYPYYRLIARSNEIRSPFNRKVIEAYWTGNSLLEKVRPTDLADMMRKDFLPLGKMPEEKIKNLPGAAIPFHSFHVLFIGSITGRFKGTERGLDLCRVSWGRIRKIKRDKLVVSRQPLKFGKKIVLGKPAEIIINWNKDILSRVGGSDWVSIHWNTAIEKLNPEKLKNLEKYTERVLKIV